MKNPRFLTPRENEVMEWVSKGKTNWEIGQILGCSQFTVKHHMSNIREKLDVTSKAGAVREWLAKGVLRHPRLSLGSRSSPALDPSIQTFSLVEED